MATYTASHWVKLLPGAVFGDWTIIAFSGRHSDSQPYYRCRCVCGREKEILASNLTTGKTRSCGHWRPSVMRQKMKLAHQLLSLVETADD